jgi:lipooligosaccharide transport system ATP-binding protein
MDQGRIIERGAPRDLVAKHLGREALELTMPPALDARVLARVAGLARAHERFGEDLRLFGEDGEELLAVVHGAGVRPERHLVRRATLEDVFLKLTGRALND